MMPRFCRLLVFSFAARNGSCSFYFRYPLRFFIECTYYFLWQTDFIEKTRKSAHSVFEIKTICTNFRILKQIRKENIFKSLCEYSVRQSMFDFYVFFSVLNVRKCARACLCTTTEPPFIEELSIV